MSRYPLFDVSRIQLEALHRRGHHLRCEECRPLIAPAEPFQHPRFSEFVDRIKAAREQNHPVILMMGGHPIKLGLSRFLVDLVERGLISHVASNGAAVIHDYELALAGGTSEDVAHWIQAGQFGLWRETSSLNDIIVEAAERGEGLGEAVGRFTEQQKLPHRALSLAAAAWRSGIPFTCHVSIGSDIIHSHPNCSGRALGQTSYTDFLIFAATAEYLEGGVFINLGTAVTGPEVFLKALSMARNVAHQRGKEIRHFTTAVFDLLPLPESCHSESPQKDDFRYYFRPWKTLLVRSVADGGTSFYFCSDHCQSIPALWASLTKDECHRPNHDGRPGMSG